MKAAATIFIAIIIATVLLVSGCSKNIETQTGDFNEPQVLNEDFDDQASANPDIGMLDDSPVSEDLPQ
ncbi:MAG: hypothetical protein ACP5NW_04635 [Candidatus Woesearchaeota archaeon]